MKATDIMFFVPIIFVFVSVSVISLEDTHDFTQAQKLVESGISCDELTDEQLESIGDYYMEQMHPGQAHEVMDKMMGGEGSESLRQTHILMARRLYCNENVPMGYGIIGSGGMMGAGMMGSPLGYTSTGFGYWSVVWVILLIVIIVVIGWLIHVLSKRHAISQTPLGILKMRLARGEISQKEFESMKKEMEE